MKMPAPAKGHSRSYAVQEMPAGTPRVLNAVHHTPEGTHVDRWTPDAGWVDYPPDADEVFGMNTGTRTITPAEAGNYADQGLGPDASDLPDDARVCQPGD